MSESQQQAAVVQRFRRKWPMYRILAIPNGTHIRSYKGRQKNKNEGLLKGASDLLVVVPRGGYHGMFLEMKDVGKTQSSVTKEQKAFIQYANWAGYYATWAAGCDQANDEIDWYMNLGVNNEKSNFNGPVQPPGMGR